MLKHLAQKVDFMLKRHAQNVEMLTVGRNSHTWLRITGGQEKISVQFHFMSDHLIIKYVVKFDLNSLF